MQTALGGTHKGTELPKCGRTFLKILARAIQVADTKVFSLVSAGGFSNYLDKFMASGKMKKACAEDLLETTFRLMIQGEFKKIDPGVHLLVQGIAGIRKDVYNVHLQGDLMITYAKDEVNKTIRLFYMGNHSNHPSFSM